MIQFLQEENSNLEHALECALKKLEKLTSQNFELSKMLNTTFKTIKIKNEETEIINNYIKDVKEKTSVYYPVKEDELDTKLAETLNGKYNTERFNTLFRRESEGVYYYGTKKILIKSENGKIISKIY